MTAAVWARCGSIAVASVVALAGGAFVARGFRARHLPASSQAPLAVSVRALEAPQAWAGGTPVPPSPLDRTWEVRVDALAPAHAALVVTGERGRAVGPAFPFERVPGSASRLRALVPLRALAPHRGATRGVVVLGDAPCVDACARDIELAADAEAEARRRGARCGARVERADLGEDFTEPYAAARIEEAEQLVRAGDPARALVLVDRLRGGASGAGAARADAVAAEAAVALGRNVLARTLARRGLDEPEAIEPALRARLLRTAILAQAEAAGATPREIEGRAELRASEASRPAQGERILDAALDLRIAIDHDRLPGPVAVPEAARHLLDVAAGADEAAVGAAAAMVCRASRGEARPGAGESALARAMRTADSHGSLADRAYCASAAADEARDAGQLEDAEALYLRAIGLLADHPLPREQRETWFNAARLSARRGRLGEAFARGRTAYTWVDFSLALETDLAERDGLLVDTFGYYGWAERFAIGAGDPAAAITAAEWGKARTFAALLRDDGELADGAAGSYVVARDDERGARGRLDAFAGSLRPDDAALSYTALGADDAGRVEIAIGVVTRDRRVTYLVERPRGLCSDVRALGAAVAAGDEPRARALGRHLYDVLVAPAAPALTGATRLFVSPHLCLQALDWPALFDGARFLVERFAVARVPPLVAIERTARDDEPVLGPAASRAWMLAYDPARAREASLPGLEPLAAELAARVRPVLALTGEAVTPERFLEGLARVDAVFFAGHARYDAKAPLRSALLVAPSPSGDDRVEARAVLGLGHRLDLVLLLGCETSRLLGTPLDYSDEAMGLPRAFLAGGARHVIGALWPVLDRDAEDFVRAFLAQGEARDVVSAVGAAQRCMIEKRCNARGIAAWGSFLVDAR